MDELTVHIQIAGRTYPLEIPTADEEMVRRAGKMIQDELQLFRKEYNLRDNQDALAMYALNISSKYQQLLSQAKHQDDELSRELNAIVSILDQVRL